LHGVVRHERAARAYCAEFTRQQLRRFARRLLMDVMKRNSYRQLGQ